MAPAATLPPSAFVPARWPPRLYFGFAHACLFTAFSLIAFDPRGIGGFFYHPRMLAVVHLVTLGWISSSILGSLYLVLPLAFRASLPSGRGDFAAFAAWAIGVSGMVFHFWIDRPKGMAWAAAMVLLVFAFVAARGLAALRGSPLPAPEKRPLALALANVLLAGMLGVLLGVDKFWPVLPGAHLRTVLAHAHLAALGFATMMIVGTGYRLLPMVLPAAMPKGRAVRASIVLLEIGALGLFAALAAMPSLVPLSALLVVLGIAAFFSRLVWMLRNRRPAPTSRPRPDASVGHVLQSFLYLGLAAALGFWLALAQPSEATLRASMAYGTFGLLGFLSQLVVGVESRIFPLAAWLQGHAARGYADQPPPLDSAASPKLQLLTLALWTGGVPSLAAGLACDRPLLSAAAAGGLALATLASATNLLQTSRRLA